MKRRAFTLVELLVVIGIIAVLVSLLLPVLARSREITKRIACLGNLRTLGTAMMFYTQDNNGGFPMAATGSEPEDWAYWQGGRNPNPGTVTGSIMTYIGATVPVSTVLCPSDELISHPTYPYSYSVNWHVCPPYTPNFEPPIRLSAIRHPSRIIMILDESSQTIDDGCWAPEHYILDGRNLLSNRHDKEHEDSKDPNDGRGNCAFCDGHVEFFPRLSSLDPLYFSPSAP